MVNPSEHRDWNRRTRRDLSLARTTCATRRKLERRAQAFFLCRLGRPVRLAQRAYSRSERRLSIQRPPRAAPVADAGDGSAAGCRRTWMDAATFATQAYH